MSQRLNEYFVKEAGDYLDQIAQLLGDASERPDTERLVRLARGVRGSAQMAGAGGVAPVTERLEGSARSVHTQFIQWSEALGQLLLDTVSELRALLNEVEHWSDQERERVRALMARWESSDREATQPSVGSENDANDPAHDGVVPISSLFYDDAGPHVIHAPDGPQADEASAASQDTNEAGVVSIETLLFRGSAAARAALALRPRVDQLLASGAGPDELAPLHDEIFDLLELSISESSA